LTKSVSSLYLADNWKSFEEFLLFTAVQTEMEKKKLQKLGSTAQQSVFSWHVWAVPTTRPPMARTRRNMSRKVTPSGLRTRHSSSISLPKCVEG